jgi:SAM-dependent methyltransferase
MIVDGHLRSPRTSGDADPVRGIALQSPRTLNQAAQQRVRARYEGEHGRAWERIETARPASYFEENVAFGRRPLVQRLIEWLEPRSGLHVLDGGCGLGRVAAELAGHGATVTGVDLVPRFVEAARRTASSASLEFDVGSFVDRLRPDGKQAGYAALLLLGVLEDYSPAERHELIRHVADAAVPRIYLAFRFSDDRGSRLWNLFPEAQQRSVNSVELLRWIHLHTAYRQRRQDRFVRRNFRCHLAELVREPVA